MFFHTWIGCRSIRDTNGNSKAPKKSVCCPLACDVTVVGPLYQMFISLIIFSKRTLLSLSSVDLELVSSISQGFNQPLGYPLSLWEPPAHHVKFQKRPPKNNREIVSLFRRHTQITFIGVASCHGVMLVSNSQRQWRGGVCVLCLAPHTKAGKWQTSPGTQDSHSPEKTSPGGTGSLRPTRGTT